MSEAPAPVPRPRDLDSTAALLGRIREGDEEAQERLFARVLPALQRWAQGRLPAQARGFLDTDDLVQVTLLRALVRLDEFEPRHEGAFLAYLRQILLNAIRERIRRGNRQPAHEPLDENALDEGPAALEVIVGRERMRQYEAALATLPDDMQHAVILKLEFSYSHQQVAEALGKKTPEAARKVVARAVKRLARAMGADESRAGMRARRATRHTPTLEAREHGHDAHVSAPPPPPSAIGGFRVQRELGRGGMGVVYLARDLELDRPVAIKTLPEELALDADRLAQFRREAKVLASLNHPNIATIHGIEVDERGSRFLVLEWVDGVTLADRLQTGPLTIEESLDVLAQITEALAAAHEADVVHRDLKPRNVMVLAGRRVKVLDFGLARHATAPRDGWRLGHGVGDATSPIDTSQALVGTAAYMSPERVLGSSEDLRGDIFAFGCVAYECLCGRPAFEGESVLAVLTRVVKAEPDWSALPAETPAELRTLLAECLEKTKERRPTGMDRVRRAIERARERRRPIRREERGEPATTNNLPKAVTSFVGRDVELARCARLLGTTRLLTLTGPGGCGKTRLALEAARSALAANWRGVWFVPLAPLQDATYVPDVVASVIGAPPGGGEATIERIVRHIGRERILLILDNCEHVQQGAVPLARELIERCPALVLVATGREALGVSGEHVELVRPLAIPGPADAHGTGQAIRFDAVRLFAERATQSDVAFELGHDNVAAVVEICRRLDGIPLAIELAAARARVLGPSEIAARLDRQLRLLETEAAADPRHATLRGTIRWSVDLLTPEEQKAFRALSVFAGGWDLEAAAVVFEAADADVALDRITTLTNRSLVVVEPRPNDPTRYRYLEPVRQGALELLVEAGEEASARARHRGFYRSMVRANRTRLRGVDEHHALDWFELEQPNVLAAIDGFAMSTDGSEDALEMASHLGRFWHVRGHNRMGLATLRHVLDLPRMPAPVMARGWALLALGGLEHHSNEDSRLAIAHLAEALEIFRAFGDRLWLARCLGMLGGVAIHARRHLEGIAWLEEAEQLFREVGGDEHGVILGNLGAMAWAEGNLERARDHYEAAAVAFRASADTNYLAESRVSLAFIELAGGEHERAREHLAEALRTVGRIKARNLFAVGGALVCAARLELARGAYPATARLLGAADALLEGIGVPLGPDQPPGREATLQGAREQLGTEAFERAFAEGRRESLDAALAAALAAMEHGRPRRD